MKQRLVILFIFAALLIAGFFAFQDYRLAHTDTTPMWEAVKAARDKGLPQTAITELKKIYPIEVAKKNYSKALKAITLQIFLESNVAGNKPEVKVTRMKEEIARAGRQMKPLMEAVLARWYWQYYNQNRYRFLNRTQTSNLKEDDFTTWDLPKLFGEIDGIYQSLLRDEGALKRMKTADFKDVIAEGNATALRPTLFDFVAYQALDFYTSAEQHAAKPEDSFEVTAESDAFAGASKFLGWSPKTTDKDSPVLKALTIYRRLLDYHVNDRDKDAFLDTDINRLCYVFNIASGDKKEEIYEKRLNEIVSKYPASPLSSLAYWHLATRAYSRNEYTKAYSLAEKGKNSHPSSYGGEKCAELMSSITAKSVTLRIEGVAQPGLPSKMLVQYRNIDTITVKVLKDDWKRYLDTRKSMSSLNEEEALAFLGRKPVAELTIPLKPTEDYKQKEALVDLPALPPGLYKVFVSGKKDFSRDDNCIEHCSHCVSRIAAVIRQKSGSAEGIVVDGASGAPFPGATVRMYTVKDYNETRFKLASSTATDSSGCFAFPSGSGDTDRRMRIYISDNRGSEYFEPGDSYHYYQSDAEKAFQRTVFFTDRSIYRPGQTVHFKGILIDVDQSRQSYKTISGRKVSVRFTDTNGQEISKSELTSNDFGSFSGTFTAPKDRLTGRMTIASDTPDGSTSISVEEYKRPKFSVKMASPSKAFALNEEVTVEGSAESYSGAPIDGAKVTYRVTRQVMLPPWGLFFRGGASFAEQEIGHGKALTDSAGKFKVSFQAKPDEKVKRSEEPTFNFRVSADVTDSTGETRSDGKSIRLGYTSMEASINAEPWQTADRPVSLSIGTSTLDGEPQKAEGEIEVFSLRQPGAPVRPGLKAPGPGYYPPDEEEGEGSDEPSGGAASTDYKSWPQGDLVKKAAFSTDSKGHCTLSVPLKEGAYRARLTSKDVSGNKVTAMVPFLVINRRIGKFPVTVPSYYVCRSESVEAGGTFEAFWGTGYGKGQACVEIYRENRLLKRYWTSAGSTQSAIDFPVTKELRGGFAVLITYVRENRLYSHRSDVDVPWSDRVFDVSLETFRSKLLPGARETWTLKVKGPGAERRAAEVVAAMYDESLDAFAPHQWQTLIPWFFRSCTSIEQRFTNRDLGFSAWVVDWNTSPAVTERVYPSFIAEIAESLSGFGYMRGGYANGPGGSVEGLYMKDEADAGSAGEMQALPKAAAPMKEKKMLYKSDGMDRAGNVVGGAQPTAAPPLTNAQGAPKSSGDGGAVRKNLNETAFFYPHLLTAKDGTVKIVFTMPEALTKWHFMAMAHGKAMESGYVDGHTVTQKDLMVVPNAPRFLREGDEIEFTAKVVSMSDKEIKGRVNLNFFDPVSGQSLDRLLGNGDIAKEFTIPAKQSKGFSWRIKVPDGLCAAGFRATAEAGKHRDGEEGAVPVLPRRVFVSESLPLWIRGPGEKSFTFEKLKKSASSKTIANQGFTVQIASNPSWYAVQALPYLMEYPHECSEQVFNRLYANSLARHIALSSPRIAHVFRIWKEQQPSALDSQLEKNEELKSVLLLETPWVLEAKQESAAKHNIAVLFDEKRLLGETASAGQKLSKIQLDSGAFPWFPGGRPDPFITLYIATGFGRLKQMQAGGIEISPALRAVDYLDRWIAEEYQEIVKHGHKNDNNLTSTVALYLYCRGFYAAEKPVPQQSKEAVDYFMEQAKKHWLDLGIRMSQAHIAMGLWRLGDQQTAKAIMASIKERSLSSEEMGMYWGEDEQSWWWYRAPIETQALMIEAFGIIMNDEKSVEDCKVWLLKQKETQDWKTTKATADAIYALICKGEDLLAGGQPVEVTVGGEKVDPGKVEEGTGFYEKRWDGPSVKPDFGSIVLKKQNKGIAWGGAHWQYMEDISNLTPSAQNPLKLSKSVFLQKNTKKGPVIEQVSGALAPGDLLKIRIELRSDRDMEYVHMWDHRGSGLEPVNVLSGYKFQDGLYYYESTKDTASHFYIDYLPKGTYVFEYPLRVVHCGAYQNGAAHVECMYAPQFRSHSGSVELKVK